MAVSAGKSHVYNYRGNIGLSGDGRIRREGGRGHIVMNMKEAIYSKVDGDTAIQKEQPEFVITHLVSYRKENSTEKKDIQTYWFKGQNFSVVFKT